MRWRASDPAGVPYRLRRARRRRRRRAAARAAPPPLPRLRVTPWACGEAEDDEHTKLEQQPAASAVRAARDLEAAAADRELPCLRPPVRRRPVQRTTVERR